MEELEKEKVAELFQTKAVLTAVCFDDAGAASQANLTEYMRISVPWLVSLSTKDSDNNEDSEIQRMIKMYKNYQEAKEQEE